MEINYEIEKQRGNFRPVVKYTITLGENEAILGIPPLKIDSGIKKPVNSWEKHCYPDKNERAGLFDKENYQILTPGFKNRESKGELRLGFNDSNDYKEVYDCFIKVRDIIEKEILKAKDFSAFNKSFKIGFSDDFKTERAPSSAKDMFLKAVGM
eukprot:gnl/Chilomastix_cuspidata/10007.p2 GENE.gnl/Chilomastix_cuspidata/10007~~gnl/Chilomastix_cuspidata/10007.p2  ORF type:complete len:154 (-),score=10.29 gnl/Chilomastix_cuspidata/10007:47-508(-)